MARGRLELARDTCESEHLDAVASAHERMDALIEELLALAREEESVTEVEPVDLADLVESSWESVETGAATLAPETELTIRADEARLRRLIENLLRNAVEHGGESVTVEVGALSDDTGFYLADDGVGISAEDRDAIFQAGYTTTAGGTGVGLDICREIAAAHDWDIQARESDAGGARFEIAGVEIAD